MSECIAHFVFLRYTEGMNTPYDYMPLIMNAIDLISQGYTETRACDDVRLSVSTFKHYIKANDELQDLYTEAVQRGSDAMADALLAPDNHHLYGHGDSKMAKVQSDNLKWFLSKRDPKRFGDRIEVNHHITADKAITQALNAARNRTMQASLAAPESIDAEFMEIEDEEDDEALMAELGLA